MKFDDARDHATRALVSKAENLQPPSLAGARSQRRHRRPLLVGAAIAGVALFVTANAFQQPSGSPAPAAAVPTTSSPPSDQVAAIAVGWSVSYPPDWYRRDIMSPQGVPAETVMELATFAFREASESCSDEKYLSLSTVGAGDAFIRMSFRQQPGNGRSGPGGALNSTNTPAVTGGFPCAPADVRIHTATQKQLSTDVEILVAFGPGVTAELENQTWEIASSLLVGLDTERSVAPVCVATRPPEPGFQAPTPWPVVPTHEADVWYGSADLWTLLPRQGQRYVARKTVWWSADLDGWGDEAAPQVTVTWRRLDQANSETITNQDGSKQTYMPEYGAFVVAGFDPRTNGCWEVTATYKGESLTFVYEKFQLPPNSAGR